MSSARIDLSSYRGSCSAAGIDRTKPAILDPYMPANEWQTFCDDIDKALMPVTAASKIAMICFGLTFGTFILTIILIFASFGSEYISSVPTSAFFGLPLVMLLLSFGVTSFAQCRQRQALLEIQKICSETSRRQPRLSFHVRYEQYYYRRHNGNRSSSVSQYIDVSINNTTNTVAVPAGVATTDPGEPEITLDPYAMAPVALASAIDPLSTLESGTKGTPGTKLTPKERLESLQVTKHLLTEEEYAQKRKEILDDM